MPITTSAKKALKSSLRKRVYNQARKRTLQSSVKEVRKLVALGKADEAQKLLAAAYQAIDKAAKTGVIKDNAAARKKSRLAQAIKKSTDK